MVKVNADGASYLTDSYAVLNALSAVLTCSWVCRAINVALILHIPCGTEGGLTAGVKTPFSLSTLAKLSAGSASPINTGMIAEC